jgi:non-heme chloroperoxidase
VREIGQPLQNWEAHRRCEDIVEPGISDSLLKSFRANLDPGAAGWGTPPGSLSRAPTGNDIRFSGDAQVKMLKVNDDVELAYAEEGKGDAVVFVHGALGDWRTWEDLRSFISERYHYVSLSRRYHYPNQWADDGKHYSQSQHVEDLAAFILALNVGTVHLVGNSGGGRLVGLVALKYPELVRSVVLGEPDVLIAPTPTKGEAALAADQERRAKIQAAVKAGDLRQAVMLFVGGQEAFQTLPPEQQQRLLDNAKTLGLGAATPVTCEQLGRLEAPALVIRGEKSGWQEHARLLACLPKTTEFVVIPGAHHGWHRANPKASAKAILTFIAKH